MEHTIKYYPVGNADCTLIKLDNGKTIIVDCQILSDLTDGKGKQINYDVKADLLKELKKDASGRPYVDLFISTHPHDDHCKGFEDNFYHGEVNDYDKDKNKNEIIIEELWITPRGLKNNLADTSVAVRKELNVAGIYMTMILISKDLGQLLAYHRLRPRQGVR